VAWQFAFLFPCQRQPRIQDGVIEPISYAVQWGDTQWLGLSDATWQPVRGALFGDVLSSQDVTALPARLRDFPGVYPIQVYQTRPLHEAGQYTVTHDRQTRMGWEAIR
jgi:arabinosyltransferase C